MKNILIGLFLITFTNLIYGQGDAPPILKGQNQSTNQVGAKIFTPNLQITKINSSSSLIETGNKNILENPGFEHQIFDYAMAIINGIASEENVNLGGLVFSGIKALKIEAITQPILAYKTTPVQSTVLSGLMVEASAMVKSNISGLKLCPRINFANSGVDCAFIPSDNTWRLHKIRFPAGNFQNGLVLTTEGINVTGTLYTDDWELKYFDSNTTPLELKYIQRRSSSGAWTYIRSSSAVRRAVFFYCGGGGGGGGAGTTTASENKWGEGGRAGELRVCNIGNPSSTISASIGLGGSGVTGAAGNAGGSTTITGCTAAAGGAGGATATVTTSDIWMGPALCVGPVGVSNLESTPVSFTNMSHLGCYNKSRFIQVAGANYRVAGSGGYIVPIIPQLNAGGSEGANGTTNGSGFDAVSGSCGGGGGSFNGVSQAIARAGGAGGSGQIVVYEYE